MPFSGFERMNEERVEGRRAGLRQSAQLGVGGAAQARPGDHGIAAAALLRLRHRRSAGRALPVAATVRAARLLASWGIPVAPHRQCCERLEARSTRGRGSRDTVRASLDFAIDGGVVKVDRSRSGRTSASSAREPRYAIARKFAPDIAETKLLAHRGERRPDGNDQSVRDARAGGDRWRDGEARDAPQLRSHRGKGPARRETGCR